MIVYNYKNIIFEWLGGLVIRKPTDFLPIKPFVCNGILHWKLSKNVRISVNQLKKIIKTNE